MVLFGKYFKHSTKGTFEHFEHVQMFGMEPSTLTIEQQKVLFFGEQNVEHVFEKFDVRLPPLD